MKRLFSLSHKRTLDRLGITEVVAEKIDQVLQQKKIKPVKDALLYRLPRDQLKHAFNIPCPINVLDEASSPPLITASKYLRHNLNINQQKICSRCPFVDSCPAAKKQPLAHPENALSSILIYFQGLNNYLLPENIYYRQWTSAYRVGDSLIAVIDDLIQDGKQIEEYEILRIDAQKKYEKTGSEQDKLTQIPKKRKKQKKQKNQSDIQNSGQNKKNDQVQQTKLETTQQFGRDFSFEEQQPSEPLKTKKKQKVSKKLQQEQWKLDGEDIFQPLEESSERYKKKSPQKSNEFVNERQQKTPYGKKSYGQDNNYQKNRYESQGDQVNKYQKNDQMKNRYQNKNNYQNKNRYQNRNNYQNKNNYQNRNNYQNKNRYQNKNKYENRSQNRYENRYENKNKYQNKYSNQESNKFRRQNQGYQNRSNYTNNKNYNKDYEKKNDWSEKKYGNKIQGNDERFKEPKNFDQNEYSKSKNNNKNFSKADKPNPFIKQWDNEDSNDRLQPKQTQMKQQRNDTSSSPPPPPSYPKILAAEPIQSQGSQGNSPRRGRVGRRR